MRIAALIGLVGVAGSAALAQGPAKATTKVQVRQAANALDCRACHTAARPTKQAPALVTCPRLEVKGFHSVDEAPATMTLGTAGGTYGPVKFAHRDHARMAQTGQGCNGCHHYDQARSIQPCGACHSATRVRADLGKPDVQAAMHRQCLDCHRDWSAASKCGTCHQQSGAVSAPAAARPVSPKPVAPKQVVYATKTPEGRTVTFFHSDHTDRFGLDCAECHIQQSCASCHSAKELTRAAAAAASTEPRPARRSGTTSEAHARCSACHATDQCATCHTDRQVRQAGFDHRTRTGWALNRFHARLSCQGCHTAPGKFAKLNADCESCHKGWQPKFDHKKTGLALDEVHAGADCASCHADKVFVAAPSCGECHTDKSYPADKPGKVVGRLGAGK